jgi:hypothetical protein
MKETLRRRITVTSSLNEICTEHLITGLVGGGGVGVTPPAPPLFTFFLDDVNGFSSTFRYLFDGGGTTGNTERDMNRLYLTPVTPRICIHLHNTEGDAHSSARR